MVSAASLVIDGLGRLLRNSLSHSHLLGAGLGHLLVDGFGHLLGVGLSNHLLGDMTGLVTSSATLS